MLEPYDGQVGPPRLGAAGDRARTPHLVSVPARPRRRPGGGARPAHAPRRAHCGERDHVRGRDRARSRCRTGWPRRRPGPGVLVLEGVLARRACASATGPRPSCSAPATCCSRGRARTRTCSACEIGWRALVPARFAMLDAGFAERVRPWPEITQVLLRRAGRRARNLNVQRAIAAQPRLEVRLALLLWHLAARWGKVEPGGIRLPVPFTHQLLGRLVGAERPSVSHALGAAGRCRAWCADTATNGICTAACRISSPRCTSRSPGASSSSSQRRAGRR